MKKITDYIVNNCYVIFIVFLVLTAICGLLSFKVKINKDIYSYMPADSETSKGLAIMDDEFDYSATSSYEMMLTDVPEEERENIKDYIASVEGVKKVEFENTDDFVRGEYTRYKITIDAPADSETANKAYHAISDKYRALYKTAEAGQVSDYNGSVLQITTAIMAVGFAMIILTIMSKSWVEPWLFLFAILLAVVVNKGTNIIFPSVSHITDSICAILQMALSMDYAIMLSTRYRQEKAALNNTDKMEAMRRAMRYSFGAISSSSVTTVVGLIVLIFMSFTIGKDMGLVLSKGVILSLVSIFTSLPALLLLFDKAIEKTAKKSPVFKMKWLGTRCFNLRHIALPLFLVAFVGSFIMKGSTAIDFTASQNNKIKDVFNQPNQLALVYNKNMDEEVTKTCYEFDAREDTKRVLCYGNTINEPEKYNEVVPKINDLSTTEVDTEDYLIKAIFYHYYKDVDSHEIALDDLVNFLQQEVFPNEEFADDMTDEIKSKVNRFSYFTNHIKVNKNRTRDNIASILEVEPSKLDDLYTLYYAEQNVPLKLTLYQFASFVNYDILTNPSYASMLTAENRADLRKLLLFSNSAETDAPRTLDELSETLGINRDTLEQLMVYYNYTTTTTPEVELTFEQLVNFALNDETIIAELGLPEAELENIRNIVAEAKTAISNIESSLPEDFYEQNDVLAKLKNFATSPHSYAELESLVLGVDETITNLENAASEYIDITEIDAEITKLREMININGYLAKLKKIYTLYQAENTAASTNISIHALVDFLLAHANDEKLNGAISSDSLALLNTANDIMDNQNTGYTAAALSQKFGLDYEKLKLVYALYNYRYVGGDPMLSLNTLINFIDEKVLPNPEYADHLSENEQTELHTIAVLMRAAAAGTPYNYESLYRAILPLSNGLDKNQLFVVYLYHGSLYDYDENWTMTLEQFIGFINDSMLPDERFATRIDDEMRKKVADGYDTIMEAKDLLVGPKHYRALIETDLPVEGKETTTLISELKTALGPKNKVDYFLVGDSAMAYEMSLTFNDEMNFITILTMLSIFAVVVCTFKSVFISLLLVLIIQCAVYLVMAYLSITGSSIYFIALIIVQAILMGATIDYAILYTSYYVENRKAGLSVKDALICTYEKSIGAILTSASILIIVTAIVGNLTTAIASSICKSISLGTFCATLIILFLLPPLLAVLDKFIIKKKSAKKKGILSFLSWL